MSNFVDDVKGTLSEYAEALEARNRALLSVPESITRSQLTACIHQFGLDPANLRGLVIDRSGVEAEVFALNAKGQKYAQGDEVATHVLTIRIEEDE